MDNLIIIGFMGSGKGTIASVLAKKLDVQKLDLDSAVSKRLKMTSPEIYDRYGEAYYRAMEYLILDEWAANEEKRVLVLGSGALMMPQNVEKAKKLGKIYYIRRDTNSLITNIKNADKKHAWIRGDEWENKVKKLFAERKVSYENYADVVIDAKGKSIEDIVEEILAN